MLFVKIIYYFLILFSQYFKSYTFGLISYKIFYTYISVQSKVRCTKQMMEVDIVRSSPQAKIYLQQFKHFPGEISLQILYAPRINKKYSS